MTKAATDFRVRGLVQGVGFRPTVYRIALEMCIRDRGIRETPRMKT